MNLVTVVIPERFKPSCMSPVINQAKIKVSMVPISLQEILFAICRLLSFIFNFFSTTTGSLFCLYVLFFIKKQFFFLMASPNESQKGATPSKISGLLRTTPCFQKSVIPAPKIMEWMRCRFLCLFLYATYRPID